LWIIVVETIVEIILELIVVEIIAVDTIVVEIVETSLCPRAVRADHPRTNHKALHANRRQ